MNKETRVKEDKELMRLYNLPIEELIEISSKVTKENLVMMWNFAVSQVPKQACAKKTANMFSKCAQ